MVNKIEDKKEQNLVKKSWFHARGKWISATHYVRFTITIVSHNMCWAFQKSGTPAFASVSTNSDSIGFNPLQEFVERWVGTYFSLNFNTVIMRNITWQNFIQYDRLYVKIRSNQAPRSGGYQSTWLTFSSSTTCRFTESVQLASQAHGYPATSWGSIARHTSHAVMKTTYAWLLNCIQDV